MLKRLPALSLCLALGACATIPPPTVGEIVDLAKAGSSASDIVATIDAGAGVYPLSATEIARLSREGVPDAVLDHMLRVWLNVETRRAYLDGQFASNWPYARPFYRYAPLLAVPIAQGEADTVTVVGMETVPAPAGFAAVESSENVATEPVPLSAASVAAVTPVAPVVADEPRLDLAPAAPSVEVVVYMGEPSVEPVVAAAATSSAAIVAEPVTEPLANVDLPVNRDAAALVADAAAEVAPSPAIASVGDTHAVASANVAETTFAADILPVLP